jgi:small subunit ribosomal protein S6
VHLRDYEMTFIVSPEVGDEKVPAVVDKVKQFIANAGGEVTKVDTWGRRRLAYPLNGFREGYYFVTTFKLGPQGLNELERSVKLSEEIIRYLTVRLGE